jgi:hypothetical protein
MTDDPTDLIGDMHDRWMQFCNAVEAAISSAGSAERAKLARIIETHADEVGSMAADDEWAAGMLRDLLSSIANSFPSQRLRLVVNRRAAVAPRDPPAGT